MDGRGVARLVAARMAALYLLSLLAAAGADLAWQPPSLRRLASHAVGLGFAVGLGSLLPDALSGAASASLRARTRLAALLFLPLPGLVALAVAVAAPRLAGTAASALALLQVAVLLLADALALELLVLWGALVLTLLAALAGGLPALVGLTGFLVLSAAFFALDHVVRRLAAWPGTPAPALGRVLVDALQTVAAPAALLASALLVLPPPSPAALAGGGTAVLAPEVRRAYEWLMLVALAGGAAVTLLVRWLRGGESEAAPLVEPAESRVEAEEALEPDAFEDARYAPARGRVIRAYLRFLSRAREAGFRLEPHLTPREIQDRVRRPEDPIDRLTRLFMDARYGPDEPGAEAVRSAEAASRAACAQVHARPRTRRRRLAPGA
jgi:Domain of unknown function (DUF4129)